MIHNHTFEVGGKTLSLETGRVANQAGGSVLVGLGETVVLATATMSKTAREGIDFLPLVCDFEERRYAIGRIPGGYNKRGGRPSDRAILTSRLIDRPIRPLFPKGMRNDVQVITMAFSVDKSSSPDALAITAAGVALAVSDIPFAGPVAGVRVADVDGEFVVFPTHEELAKSKIDLAVAGHKGAISMVEAGASEVSEDRMTEALEFAHKMIKVICGEIEKFAKKAGKDKREPILDKADTTLVDEIKKKEAKTISSGIFDPDKAKRESAMDDLAKELISKYQEKYAGDDAMKKAIPGAVDKAIKDTIRKFIIEDGKRPDGRKVDEIRPLEAIAGLLPRVHGSGLFTRGQTQVLSICTLGLPGDAQSLDTPLDEVTKEQRYMHYYNFPPYSVGEVRPLRGVGRREVGHGALAERALRAVVPVDNPEYPFSIQVISEVLESNGSTSMASVCAGVLALMDAGVPLKAPVAGISVGLVTEYEGETLKRYTTLTDIIGSEDHFGDMDFKLCGTSEGVTGFQLDLKLPGISHEIIFEAVAEAKRARGNILDVMNSVLASPRAELSQYAPRIETIRISPDKIGLIIGPGGKTIKGIVAETGAEINIEDDGAVHIYSNNGDSLKRAKEIILGMTKEISIGELYQGTVVSIKEFGAFVEVLPGKDGLCHISELADFRVNKVEDVVKMGDSIWVKCIGVDDKGRVKLSRKAAMKDRDQAAAAPTEA